VTERGTPYVPRGCKYSCFCFSVSYVSANSSSGVSSSLTRKVDLTIFLCNVLKKGLPCLDAIYNVNW
jgi:hypothetical protein